jgi:hypothetical protein
MDPVKVLIFVGAFLLFLLLGKKLSTSDDSHAVPGIPVPFIEDSAVSIEEEEEKNKQPAAVGADLPFPLRLPDLELRDDGTYNRPQFLNYYFAKIDLITGPPDPNSFCDEFFIETRDPKNKHQATYQYLVATPAGLQRQMQSERLSALYLDNQTVIVASWDLTLILDTTVQEIIKTYGGWAKDSDEYAPPDAEASW